MLPDQIVAGRVKQHREAPWISEGDQMRLSWVELDIEHFEERDLFSRDARFVDPVSQGGM